MKVREGIIARDDMDYYRRYSGDCQYRLNDLRGQHIETFCVDDFHKYTNLRLKPGEQARVRINIETIDE
jgi:hypothetical protein